MSKYIKIYSFIVKLVCKPFMFPLSTFMPQFSVSSAPKFRYLLFQNQNLMFLFPIMFFVCYES
ncbi:MAG: hypothetical protein EXX96DRAFT_585497 [Benjaminiella poitrasii]|nr:MAG: hypothetical protein EXX96DRAFT_592083 [Benjaminiella poitrasii]KAI9470710.1 MAG: hypothetical protein EXX96DRAFT_585497 [Benjaminiella poitrasii]